MANDYGRGGNYNNQSRQGGQNFQHSGGQASAALPEGYLKGGYFCQYTSGGETRKLLRREYIIDYPKKIAAALGDKDKNKGTQLRKFYDYCVAMHARMENKKSFEEIESELCRLLPFAKYALARKKVTEVFVQFIEKNLDYIKDERSFDAFLKHFEAVIAYVKNK